MTTPDQGAETFIFEDENMELLEDEELPLDVDDSRSTVWWRSFLQQRHQEADSIQEALVNASTAEEVQRLNDRLVELQRKILTANAQKIKEREERNKSVFQTVQTAECVDLCFIIDATNSMKKAIQNVKDSVRIIIREIKRTNPTLNLRMAVVVYRDLHYKHRVEVLDFVDSISEFED